jgi:hypothetical protein
MTSVEIITHIRSYVIVLYRKWGFYKIILIILSFFSIFYFTFLMFESSFNNRRDAFTYFIQSDKNDFSVYNSSIPFHFKDYPKTKYLYQRKDLNFSQLESLAGSKTKKIFYWNGFFGNQDFDYGLGDKVLETKKCPVTKCEFINDRSRLNESDLVLVHMRDPIDRIPDNRPVNQRWVFVLYESPLHSDSFEKYNGVFNLTSTYRIDSEFPGFYAENVLKWTFNPNFNENFDFYQYKKDNKFAAALISNSNDKSNRRDIIKDLQKYIQVDIFGGSGIPCSQLGPDQDCRMGISKHYKFFLAFENSICKEYITEKLFRTLRYNIIPVVMGAGPYDFYVIILILYLKMKSQVSKTFHHHFRFQNRVILMFSIIQVSKNWPNI